MWIKKIIVIIIVIWLFTIMYIYFNNQSHNIQYTQFKFSNVDTNINNINSVINTNTNTNTNINTVDWKILETKPQQDIYYNGTLLSDAVKSNDLVNKQTMKIISKCKDDKSKTIAIYNYIINNYCYDYEKADRIRNNDNINSSIFTTFKNKSGVCFDLACLYTAMCNETKIRVRLIAGLGFNNINWDPHAWNQVFIDKYWYDIDVTFNLGDNNDNYNNNNKPDFNDNHRDGKVIGEW